MSTWEAILLIAEITVLLYLMWRILDWTFAAIEVWQAAWREERYRATQAGAEDPAKPTKGKAL